MSLPDVPCGGKRDIVSQNQVLGKKISKVDGITRGSGPSFPEPETPCTAQASAANYRYHVLNRGNHRAHGIPQGIPQEGWEPIRGQELLCRNPANLALILPRIMGCEDKQIAAPGSSGGLRCRLPSRSCASTQAQPQEVHSAAVVGLPGAQRVRGPRLPGFGRAFRQPPRPCQPDRAEDSAALHDLPEGCPATAGGHAGAQDVRR